VPNTFSEDVRLFQNQWYIDINVWLYYSEFQILQQTTNSLEEQQGEGRVKVTLPNITKLVAANSRK